MSQFRLLSKFVRLSPVLLPIAAGTGNHFTSCSAPPKRAPTDLKNKVVLITGATAGIGMACAWQFAELGSKLILLGRREDRLEELKKAIIDEHPDVKVHVVAMSVTDKQKVAELPSTLPSEFSKVYCLVNNAGLVLGVSAVEGNNVENAQTVLDTNVLGVISMCSAFLPGMKERGEGHVVNMGSCAGHYAYATGSIYNASKFAVRGFSEAARHDLAGTPIRMTHISPGLVGGSEFSLVRLGDQSKADAVYAGIVALSPEDVADNVIYAATRPAHVQIAEIIMYATNQSGPRDVVRVGESLGK
eukprot:CAMPEP_0119038566 /NCGR_PEP_ID=MMETSP1177-20130426/7553_1 /TAXON_ID=2985 /ORGANISM="Ochromonas sp, Strain CCMP1899" /LENGTH=301 /DNA_ID=CAMNT_0007001311 /DNA_START=52 /DNA_END=957 /DNA_ORIENTATION=+